MDQTAGQASVRSDETIDVRAEHTKAPWATPRLTVGSIAVRTEACATPSTVEYSSSKLGS